MTKAMRGRDGETLAISGRSLAAASRKMTGGCEYFPSEELPHSWNYQEDNQNQTLDTNEIWARPPLIAIPHPFLKTLDRSQT